MRLRRSSAAIDSPDVGAMRRAALRTRLVRSVLVVAAVVLLAAAAASARGPGQRHADDLVRSPGVVVADLSLSISPQDYETVRTTLRRLVASGGSLGLVLFSDVPYEMLPPGTPVSELEPLIRLLTPRQVPGKRELTLPATPWFRSFSAGTRISSALELAREMLERDHVEHGAVLLLSDLVTAPEDIPQLARTLQGLRDAGISVRVVPLTPLRNGRTLFEGLLGKQALLPPSRIAGSQPLPQGSRGLPVALLVLGALVLLVLAAHERLAGRLWLPGAEVRQE